jgi:hypothetical protein
MALSDLTSLSTCFQQSGRYTKDSDLIVKLVTAMGDQLCLTNLPFFCPVSELQSVSRNASSLIFEGWAVMPLCMAKCLRRHLSLV